ncbi:hypothetical protein A5662_02895 [Mycobacteriaceae bacterium 1482268.1]|nr:hypothetical protein A5662_02895 [Mycobacteriaceae bacterium 1482268.1]
MPSIPQSLLWISLVVLWLFVLVPMLISKRDAVRRTSDVALSTRVLNSASSSRLLKRAGPASGHRSDPDWQPSEDELDDGYDDDYEDDEEEAPTTSVVLAAPAVENPEPDYLDVDVVEEPVGALPVGESHELTLNFEESKESVPEEEDVDTAIYEVASDEYELSDDTDHADDAGDAGTDDEYEYVDDSSGLEAPEESDLKMADSMMAARRRRYDPAKAAAISARKYKFRKRMLAVMTLAMAASAATAYFAAPWVWYVCGSVAAVTLLYLGYLRRQTRIEERLRRRRLQRMARSRLGVENTEDRDLDLVPSRLRRPGSVVLEIDDEDPIFEHLNYAPSAREYDLPRAAGQ